MKICFAFCACAGLLLIGCEQTTTTTTHSATTNTTTDSHYKLTGNRSADPLGNYQSDNTNTVLTKDSSSVAQHTGSSSFPTSGNARGGL